MSTRSAARVAVGCLVTALACCVVGSMGQAGPDLFLAGLHLEPSPTVAQGEAVLVSAEVTNLGTDAAGPFTVRLAWRRVDRQTECGFVVEAIVGLEPRASIFVSEEVSTTDLAPGLYEFTAQAIVGASGPADASETNNRSYTLLEVLPPRPELHLLSLRFSPASPVEYGDTVLVGVEIENSGGLASGAFVVAFELALLDSRSVGEDSVAGSCPLIGGVADAADLGNRLWVPFATVPVPGLARDERIRLERSLATGPELAALLEDAVGSASEDEVGDCGELLREILGGDATLAVRVRIEVLTGVEELDPGNNAIVGYCSIAVSQAVLPELRPTAVTFNRASPVPYRGSLQVTVTVENVGGSPAVEPLLLLYVRQVGGSSVDWDLVYASRTRDLGTIGVEEGQNSADLQVSLSSGVFPAPGGYQLRAVVDPPYYGDPVPSGAEGAILERDEGNNEMIVGLTIAGIELRPLGLDVGADPVVLGDTMQVVTEIENTGDMTAEGFVVAFYIGSARLDTYYYHGGGLAEGERVRVFGSIPTEDLTVGSHTLRVVVDPDNQIHELDDVNNEISMSILISAPSPRRAELHPTEIIASPPSPISQGDVLVLETAVWNTGDIDAGRFRVALEVSCPSAEGGGSLVCSTPDSEQEQDRSCMCTAADVPAHTLIRDLPGLARGAKRTVVFTLPTHELPAGTYRVAIRVDPPEGGSVSLKGEVAEQDEYNNVMIISFRIGSPEAQPPDRDEPNLVFEQLAVTPDEGVSMTEELRVTGTIANRGRQPAGASLVSLWWEGAASGPAAPDVAIPELAMGATHGFELSIPGPGAPGMSTLVGRADSDGRIQDWPDDNTARASVEATGDVKADLYISRVRFSGPLPALVGEPMTAYATVENHGLLSSGPFQIALQQEGSTLFAISQSVQLPSGESMELPFDLDTSAAGNYTLVFLVDVGEVVDEASETNNGFADARLEVVDTPPAGLVNEIAGPGGEVRFLALDAGTGVLYAASSNGGVIAYDRGDPPIRRFELDLPGAGEVSDLLVVADDAAYIATEGGSVYVVDPSTGAVVDEISLPVADGAIHCVGVGADRTVYVGTDLGLVAVAQENPVIRRADDLGGRVDQLEIDTLTGFIYVRTSAGVTALDTSLDELCSVGIPGGATTTMALGTERVYVGTDDGHVYVYSKCGSTAGGTMVQRWEYSDAELLPGAVTSIVVDLRGSDPVYLTTASGALLALDTEGKVLWGFQASAGILSAPAVDRATRRLYFADANGIAYVLSGDGSEAFSVDASLSSGIHVQSEFVSDSFDLEVDGVLKHLRAFYYGGDDGAIYLVQTER